MVSALIAVQRQPNTQIHPQAQRLPCGRRHQCCGRHRSTSSGRHCPPARHQGRLGTSHPSGTRLPPAPTHHHRNVVRHRTAHAQRRCSRSRRPSNRICMAGGEPHSPSSPSPSAPAPASCARSPLCTCRSNSTACRNSAVWTRHCPPSCRAWLSQEAPSTLPSGSSRPTATRNPPVHAEPSRPSAEAQARTRLRPGCQQQRHSRRPRQRRLQRLHLVPAPRPHMPPDPPLPMSPSMNCGRSSE